MFCAWGFLFVCLSSSRETVLAVFFSQKAGQSRGGALHSSQAPSTQEASGSPARSLASCCSWQAALEIQSLQHRGSASVAESQKYLQVTAWAKNQVPFRNVFSVLLDWWGLEVASYEQIRWGPGLLSSLLDGKSSIFPVESCWKLKGITLK